MLRFGEFPVPHCQYWKVDSNLNKSLLSFVAYANKKLYHIKNGNDRPISMTMVRLEDWNGMVTIIAENVYQSKWNIDYGVALLGSLAQKAADMSEELGKEVVATNDPNLKRAMERFCKQYDV